MLLRLKKSDHLIVNMINKWEYKLLGEGSFNQKIYKKTKKGKEIFK